MTPNLTVLEAIARQEGFYLAGTRASRNHNPGNIEDGNFARSHGAVTSDGRFAVFKDNEAGFAALAALLSSASYKDLTIQQAISKYAPSNENDTELYVARVCEWTGAKPTDLISQFV